MSCRANCSLHPNWRNGFLVSSVCGFRDVLCFVVDQVVPIRCQTRGHIPPRPGQVQYPGCHLPDDLVTPLPGRCAFFIFEEDFELFPKGVLPQTTSTQIQHSSSSSRDLRPGPYVRAAIEDKQVGVDECANTQQETSVYAEDMVKIVTMAARKGHGDLVWLGFNGKKASSAKAKMMVGFGSQLVAITKPAARNLLKFWHNRRPAHIDVELLAFCNDKKASNDRCSFLWPPMGSYREHDSECCPAEGFRTSHWDFNVACQGTRPEHDSKKREKSLMGFVTSGQPRWLHWFGDEKYDAVTATWQTFWALGDADWTGMNSKREKEEARKEKNRLWLRLYTNNEFAAFTGKQTGRVGKLSFKSKHC